MTKLKVMRKLAVLVSLAIAAALLAPQPVGAGSGAPGGDIEFGSPENFLGNDPDEGERRDYWLSVSGRSTTKQGGDRYQSESCSQAAYLCSGLNSEYDPDGYSFRINTASAADADLNVEVFDPAHAWESQLDCNNNASNRLNRPSGFPDYAAWYTAIDGVKGAPPGDSAARYHTGRGDYCVGDTGQADSHVSTFIVRSPDATIQDDFDNPVYASGTCTRQYGAVDENNDWLKIIYDVYNGTDTDPDHIEFAQTYRTWTSLCTIPQAAVNSFRTLFGDDSAFVVQVRSNSPLGSPCTNPPSCDSPASTSYSQGGRNHFSIRAGYGNDLHGDVRVAASNRLALSSASREVTTGANTEMFLARVDSSHAGDTVSFEFFDTGDAGTAGTITMLQPDEIGDGSINGNLIPFTTCAFSSTGGSTNSTGCQLLNVVNNSVYQGQVVTAQVHIPTTYSCQDANPLGCWVKFRLAYPPGSDVFDQSTITMGTIEPPPEIIAGGIGVVEGTGPSTTVNMPVRLSSPSIAPVTVDWQTLDVATNPSVAHPESDYVAAAGTITFAPGETVQNFPVEVIGDAEDEPPLLWGEWGLVQFSNPTNASINTGGLFGLGLFIIFDDD